MRFSYRLVAEKTKSPMIHVKKPLSARGRPRHQKGWYRLSPPAFHSHVRQRESGMETGRSGVPKDHEFGSLGSQLAKWMKLVRWVSPAQAFQAKQHVTVSQIWSEKSQGLQQKGTLPSLAPLYRVCPKVELGEVVPLPGVCHLQKAIYLA